MQQMPKAHNDLLCLCGTELLLAPVKALVEGCKGVACGAEFTMWLTEAGRLLSAGCPQHGQLGHGTDHEYNAKDCARPARFSLLSARPSAGPATQLNWR